MSMSTSVIGFKPPDAKFRKMLEAYQACENAGVPIPEEIDKFFNYEPPDETGVKVDLDDDKKYKDAVYEYGDDCAQGYEINLEKLPKDIKIIRVVNSW